MTSEEKQKALYALKISAPVMAVTQEEFNDYIQTLNKIMDWLEQKPCKDAISRQAVLDALYELCNTGETLIENPWRDNPHIDALIDAIEELQPVNSQEKTGHWIAHSNGIWVEYYECSKCGKVHATQSDYCEKCGIRMVEPQESNHKCHTCKHYTSGEHDGSCGSYICKEYSNWESE